MYSQYRQSMLAAYQSHGSRHSFQHIEIQHPLKGPKGEALFTDIFYTRPVGNKTVVHQSGIHGAEGYLGSLIQQTIFQEVLSAGAAGLPFQLVFVHTVNPHGMAWMRRTNHENVDLNRNSHEGVLHNPHFSEFLPMLNAKSPLAMAFQAAKALPKVLTLGPSGVVSAIATGQLLDSSSVFYGGESLQIELQNLFSHLQKIIPAGNEVAAIDVHTGLGSLGDESLLLDGPDVERESVFFSRVFEKPCGPVSGVSYEAQGCVALSFKKYWLTNFVTQEFGTKPFYQVLWNLLHGTRDDLQETFFPENEWWRKVCVDAGVLRFRQILKSF
jgi:hypothetical protein